MDNDKQHGTSFKQAKVRRRAGAGARGGGTGGAGRACAGGDGAGGTRWTAARRARARAGAETPAPLRGIIPCAHYGTVAPWRGRDPGGHGRGAVRGWRGRRVRGVHWLVRGEGGVLWRLPPRRTRVCGWGPDGPTVTACGQVQTAGGLCPPPLRACRVCPTAAGQRAAPRTRAACRHLLLPRQRLLLRQAAADGAAAAANTARACAQQARRRRAGIAPGPTNRR
jgi:hypothetical protein